ncbi:YgaP family membrane protein [Halobellus clavatus]|jgi:hypothetical protein|uniref:Inner membrane protein YgaP-like transmembrane domain-containing protein n=1 Tax=Halobellus clavatus TaxID=660517 RepID=A0A1H3GH19_9EURY|nr:DUF2892 domain-containing protein [Halobellus clavatus]SDY02581.1 Protein of unknown function [Halobellus clavatus]
MAGRKQNVGRRDRIVRAILTPIAVGLAVWLFYSLPQDPSTFAAIGVLAVLAFILGTGAITGTCGVYAAVGIDTCSCETDYANGNIWG